MSLKATKPQFLPFHWLLHNGLKSFCEIAFEFVWSWMTESRYFNALNFLPSEFLLIKKLEIKKTNTTFKTDIIKGVLVFWFPTFFISKNYQGRKSVREKSTYYCKFGFTKVSWPKYHQTRKKIPQKLTQGTPWWHCITNPWHTYMTSPFPLSKQKTNFRYNQNTNFKTSPFSLLSFPKDFRY